ncbi:glutathione S-transferase C-terminal domain-containing protein [Phaeacidiphilus oryzae]|uniref:glutathione S-transferase C-terminal domain-containing protein n=1 Tax=Phaeacidiphilus oryzae TaxID=348818 RepID=UPI00068FA43D|nr:glutathione S-transferase C-terminal domain-containing protein [Phaeacidiphilus oryzae]
MPESLLDAASSTARFRDRIGAGDAPDPHRYQLYLRLGCPGSLRVSITLELLGLHEAIATTPLTPASKTVTADQALLRRAYESTQHHYAGPLSVPALCDRWSGRVVSNHVPDILDDLADRFAAAAPKPQGGGRVLPLRPAALAGDIAELRTLLDGSVTQSARRAALAQGTRRREEALRTLLGALDELDRRLAAHGQEYALGSELTAADVDLWSALVGLRTARLSRRGGDGADTEAARRTIDGHHRLWSYVDRVTAAHPAFRAAARAN